MVRVCLFRCGTEQTSGWRRPARSHPAGRLCDRAIIRWVCNGRAFALEPWYAQGRCHAASVFESALVLLHCCWQRPKRVRCADSLEPVNDVLNLGKVAILELGKDDLIGGRVGDFERRAATARATAGQSTNASGQQCAASRTTVQRTQSKYADTFHESAYPDPLHSRNSLRQYWPRGKQARIESGGRR